MTLSQAKPLLLSHHAANCNAGPVASTRLRVLCVGPTCPASTAYHRSQALLRLGHIVDWVDPESWVETGRATSILHYRTGYRLARHRVTRLLRRTLEGKRFDLVWVNGGATLGPEAVRYLRTIAGNVINYNTDDPPGGRDGRRWDTFLSAISEYDLCVVAREVNVQEYYALGARQVLRVYMSYDPVAHAPHANVVGSPPQLDVVFVGTWMPERGPLFVELIRRGVPVTIIGDRWTKAPEWKVLAPAWKGPGLDTPNYVRAVATSRVALGLVSKGNRDLHTTRSVEIPFIGTVLCAERTQEHESMYRDGIEAVLFAKPEECAERCKWLLQNPDARKSIAAAGRMRVIQLGLSNDEVLSQIVKHVGALPELPRSSNQITGHTDSSASSPIEGEVPGRRIESNNAK